MRVCGHRWRRRRDQRRSTQLSGEGPGASWLRGAVIDGICAGPDGFRVRPVLRRHSVVRFAVPAPRLTPAACPFNFPFRASEKTPRKPALPSAPRALLFRVIAEAPQVRRSSVDMASTARLSTLCGITHLWLHMPLGVHDALAASVRTAAVTLRRFPTSVFPTAFRQRGQKGPWRASQPVRLLLGGNDSPAIIKRWLCASDPLLSAAPAV
ncbi:hypothetical protein HPB48_004805 [Haemaphysalis longicornis]|uniref:Uncharacterized protein n=1 Tax=Haemaphysalis longicornis TaxID=44386 RepID=A0A9J6FE61_HAELO|nr:hypothetical protein HPB48_004805 [Haemaphysalis longicornis]